MPAQGLHPWFAGTALRGRRLRPPAVPAPALPTPQPARPSQASGRRGAVPIARVGQVALLSAVQVGVHRRPSCLALVLLRALVCPRPYVLGVPPQGLQRQASARPAGSARCSVPRNSSMSIIASPPKVQLSPSRRFSLSTAESGVVSTRRLGRRADRLRGPRQAKLAQRDHVTRPQRHRRIDRRPIMRRHVAAIERGQRAFGKLRHHFHPGRGRGELRRHRGRASALKRLPATSRIRPFGPINANASSGSSPRSASAPVSVPVHARKPRCKGRTRSR